VGIGTITPTAKVHISSSTDNVSLLHLSTPSNPNILTVTGSGYIGINTAPVSGYSLNVSGDVRIQNSRVLASQFVWYDDSSSGYIKWDDGQLFNGVTRISASTNARLEVTGSDNSTLFGVHSDSNANILTVTGSGRVGIGTSDPQAALHVEGNQVYLPNEWVWGTDTNTMLRKRTSDNVEFRMGGIDVLGIDVAGAYVENGKFGVGTILPTANVHISSSTDNASLLHLSTPSNPNVMFASGSGRVGIGTATPTARLHILNGTESGNVAQVDGNADAFVSIQAMTLE